MKSFINFKNLVVFEILLDIHVHFKAITRTCFKIYFSTNIYIYTRKDVMQGKFFSEVYASFVLQCTVSGRYCKHKTDVTAWHGIHLSYKKKSMKYSGILLCELSKLSKFNALNLLGYQTNTDASILVFKFRPKRTGFNMYAEYTRLQLTFLALHPCI